MSTARYDIINDLVFNINVEDMLNGLPMKFDNLRLDSDSLCISLGTDDVPDEVFADVTGVAMSGTIKLEIYYRVVSSVQGNDDLNSMKLLQKVVDYILDKYEYSESGVVVLEKTCQVSPRLLRVYNGNIKDFITKIHIKYERMV